MYFNRFILHKAPQTEPSRLKNLAFICSLMKICSSFLGTTVEELIKKAVDYEVAGLTS